ncbi:DedA family protein [Deinococcus cavernae]|uniref:DedA family protein n=1 Tax=Deinococcus cavernae TaxID=2320857 RepID=A0A418VCA5_9DEIO|nr:DedA family protein [Deinococcus cavernae]RJF73767.1 DedA family protein [Deinococcus cavernae]
MIEWMQNLMNSMGYLGILLLMILENLFPPLPSELIMPAAGFAAARGELTMPGVALAGTAGSVLGTLPLYFIGKLFGEERIIRWADRYGAWLTLDGDEIRKADDWFDRHGNKAVLFGRLVPGIRSLLSLPAGISEMPLPKFLIYSTIGSGVWASALAYAGYALGENYEDVAHIVDPASKIILALVGAFLIWTFIRRKRAHIGERH